MDEQLLRPMTELQAPDRPFGRILVALDASPHSRAALNVAVQIAADFQATLEGVYVKDENLLRAAQLPFAREVRSHTLSPRRLDDRRVERQLRYQAQRAEAALQSVTEQMEVTYDFRVVEGRVTEELLRASEDADLFAVGKTSTRSSRRRIGSTCQRLLTEAAAPVLVLRNSIPQPRPVVTYYDGSEPAGSALQMAHQIASRQPERPLTVYLPPVADSEIARLQEEVYRSVGRSGPYLQIRALTPRELEGFASVVREQGPVLLILPEESAPLAHVPLDHFLYEADRPLLIAR